MPFHGGPCFLFLLTLNSSGRCCRWGQAVAVINDALFVYAGKTDEFDSYSYASAPNTNDVIYLSLSSSFSAGSPPWQLVSSSVDATTSQGPSLAWGTLSKLDSSSILLFGGQPGPNSPTVIVGAADSAAILDVKSPTSPTWILEPTAWATEPIRRVRHSAVTSPSGSVFIVGGEKADGSNTAFSDHYIFNPAVPSFTLLPSNGPPGVYGHASVLLLMVVSSFLVGYPKVPFCHYPQYGPSIPPNLLYHGQ
jgi:hypothetical protein